jgi:uncharacterized protein
MRNILIDAGPIIALYRKKDKYHKKALEFIKSFSGCLITTWPVITEVMYEFGRPDIQEKFLLWIERGGIKIADQSQESVSELINLIRNYSDVPMDLADATLMVYAVKTNIKEIATIDSNFHVYRTPRKEYLKNVFPL